MTRHIKASEFKAKCLGLLDEVAQSGETVVITKRGKPVAQLTPTPQPRTAFFGCLKGWIENPEALDEPLDPEWYALKDDDSPGHPRARLVRRGRSAPGAQGKTAHRTKSRR